MIWVFLFWVDWLRWSIQSIQVNGEFIIYLFIIWKIRIIYYEVYKTLCHNNSKFTYLQTILIVINQDTHWFIDFLLGNNYSIFSSTSYTCLHNLYRIYISCPLLWFVTTGMVIVLLFVNERWFKVDVELFLLFKEKETREKDEKR